ncbi:MAG: helix-turn-helix domain-containing protein [Edaphobacter sp.]
MEEHTGSASIRQFLRNKSLKQFSSADLGWSGLVLEKHVSQPGILEDTTIDHALLMLWTGKSVARGERLASRGRFLPYAKPSGLMTLYSQGAVAEVRPTTASHFLLCAIEPVFLYSIADEMSAESLLRKETRVAVDEPAFSDYALRRIVSLLATEARDGAPSGSLYSDHLIHALAMRLLLLRTGGTTTPAVSDSALYNRNIQRTVSLMESSPAEDFTIAGLAKEAGYSRAHFLRLFREALNCSPHQFLMKLRLERARAMMKNRSLRIEEIASACGFSSDAHLSRIFHRAYGQTPSSFRKDGA